jgi:hypothetical protein
MGIATMGTPCAGGLSRSKHYQIPHLGTESGTCSINCIRALTASLCRIRSNELTTAGH